MLQHPKAKEKYSNQKQFGRLKFGNNSLSDTLRITDAFKKLGLTE